MKKFKTLIALLMTSAMILGLAGCATVAREEDAGAAPAAAAETAEAEAPAEAEEVAEAEVDEIEMYFYDLYNHGDNGQKIIDAVNAITVPLINVKVNIEWFDMGSYGTQLSMNIANGTPIDLVSIMPMPATQVAQLHASNQLMEIKDLLKENAPQTYEMMEPYFNSMTYDGGLYGLPAMKNWANNYYIMMRADVLNELGLYDKAANMTTWDEYAEVLDAVTKAKNADGMFGLGRARGNSVINDLMSLGYDSFEEYSRYDAIGDTLNLVYTDDAGKVYSLYEDEHTIAGMKRLADWYEKGYIWPDSAFSQTDGDDLVSSGVIFSKMEGGEIGVETRQLANCGTEMLCVKQANGIITTSQLVSWGIAIPSTSDEPEAACRFIEQLYTNPELINLLLMGIEGEDYVVTETGEIDYPEGLDANTVEYHEPDWLFGNQFNVLPWAGNGADYREVAKLENVNSEISPYLGFALDTSALDTTVASLSAVRDQYVASLSCGLYTDEMYEEYISKLYAADFQAYIDALQAQLDEYMSGK